MIAIAIVWYLIGIISHIQLVRDNQDYKIEHLKDSFIFGLGGLLYMILVIYLIKSNDRQSKIIFKRRK